MNAATFKQTLPEFATASDTQITFFLTVGAGLLNVDRWGDSLDYGLALFTAHHLAIANKDLKTAAAGGIPGSVQGVTTSKSVDKVSVSYDGSSVAYEGAGFWNATTYGIRFWQLAQMIGAGGVQM